MAKVPVSKTGGFNRPCGFESHPLRKIKTAFAVFIFAMWDSKGSQRISTA